jgi:hypothetical protein
MNILTDIEKVLAAVAPQKKRKFRGPKGANRSIRPTVTVPGARSWYPKLEEYAKTEKIKLGVFEADLKEVTLDGNDIRIAFDVNGDGENPFKTAIYRRIETGFQRKLLQGKWAEVNGWQFRLTEGMKLPNISFVEGEVLLGKEIEVRKSSGVFGRLLRVSILGLRCDSKGADVVMTGLASWLVSPRLVWGD